MATAEDILKKMATGDLTIWIEGTPGVGLDWSWVDLTQEEAEYLSELMPDNVYKSTE